MHVRVHVYAWWVVYRLFLCGNPFGVPFSLRFNIMRDIPPLYCPPDQIAFFLSVLFKCRSEYLYLKRPHSFLSQ